MTAPEMGAFDPDVHLGFAYVAVDDRVNPFFIAFPSKG